MDQFSLTTQAWAEGMFSSTSSDSWYDISDDVDLNNNNNNNNNNNISSISNITDAFTESLNITQSIFISLNSTLEGAGGGGGAVPPRRFLPPAMTPDLLALQQVVMNLDKLVPVAQSLGLVGNVIAVMAFMLSPLKNCSLSHYLTALAVADILNQLASLVLWVSQHGWNIYSKVGVCQLTSFVLLLSRFLTIWYLLSAHLERLLVQYGRLGSKRWCTVFRTKCIIIAVFVFSLVAFLHYIWSHVVVNRHGMWMCNTMREAIIHINRLRRVELVLALFLPMLMMLVMDVAMLVKLVSSRAHSAKTCSSSGDHRMLACLKTRRGHQHRPSDKDYALANNGEVTALTTAANNERNNDQTSSQQIQQQQQQQQHPNSNGQTIRNDTKERGSAGGGGRGGRGGVCNAADEAAEAALRIDLSKEKTRSTVMCIVAGLVFMGLTLPSAYLRARANFANFNDTQGRMPLTHYEVLLMQVFEKVNQFIYVYKVLLYVIFLSSFRRAICHVARNLLRSRCCKKRHEPVTTV